MRKNRGKGLKRFLAAALSAVMVLGLCQAGGIRASAATKYDYGKLLKDSLYFYDANMCGSDVDESSLLNWRKDCHTSDSRIKYNGKTIDLSGGYHDAGDHVKFGLPEAYAAFVLEMSYSTDKAAYDSAGATSHLKTVTKRFADYLRKCAVLNSSGNVEAYAVQVGDGNQDHSYWGSPEAQSGQRSASFATASNPSTDIVSLSAAALVMHYNNFGGNEYLTTAKKLFAFAKSNKKAVGTAAGSFYSSSGWADDYCLAAYLLYKATSDSSYNSEYNKYKDQEKAKNVWWPLCWDNVAPALAYYTGNTSGLNPNNIGGSTVEGTYKCVNDWGSARYNTSLQYIGLLYDKKTGTKTYRGWAETQMNWLLGSNKSGRCYVCGYASNSVKYPHHRAASGYTGSVQGTKAQSHVLTGALVGGPYSSGFYEDTADNYQCNEVAIDYNATLVAAAAAIYSGHIGEAVSASSAGDNSPSSGGTGYKSGTAVSGSHKASIGYMTHVQNIGNQEWKYNGGVAGTSGRSLRLEGIWIKLTSDLSGGVQYKTHVQNIGWQGDVSNGAMSGTSGRSLRLEAIQIKLTGEVAQYYDIYYRVHAQNFGWMGWAKNGASAGTAGYSYRLEAIQIVLVAKGGAAPGSVGGINSATATAFKDKNALTGLVCYRTHVQNVGWQNYVSDGEMAGTQGRSLRLEGINIKLNNAPYSGGIRYATHIQNIGWQDWKYDGDMSGTSGRSLRLEAIRIELTGEMAQHYDVYYRVHAQNIGWMGWTKNGTDAGTAGYSYRLEGIQIVLVPSGQPAPGNIGGISSVTNENFRQR